LRDLVRRVPSTEKIGKTVIVAATEGERHELGPRVVADLLIADGWEVFYVGAATPPDALALLTRERHPDAVVLCATLPAQLASLEQAVKRVRAEAPSTFILVGGQACAGVPDLASKIGADACELRAERASELLGRAALRRDQISAAELLTPREADVLPLLAAGLTNSEIAQRLTLSVPTVKTHVQHILQKLGLRNRSEVAAFAARR
jgi:DNA-binding NarL/FixJ family response regulator